MRIRQTVLAVVALAALGTRLARADVFDFSYGGGDIEGGLTITATPTGTPGVYSATGISGDFEIGNYGNPFGFAIAGLAPIGSYQGNDNLVYYPGPSGAFDASGLSWVLDNGSLQNVATYVYQGVTNYNLTTDYTYNGSYYGGSLDEVFSPRSRPRRLRSRARWNWWRRGCWGFSARRGFTDSPLSDDDSLVAVGVDRGFARKFENSVLWKALQGIVGTERAERLLDVMVVPAPLLVDEGPKVSRAVLAQALNMLLFEDLLARGPMAAAYVADCLRDGKTVLHDHGAVRTVALAGMGRLPAGEEAIVRLLRPLGYERNGVYPLERLKMTGRSYAQADYPEEVAQFFISELHPEQFSPAFQAAVERVTGKSIDPLTDEAQKLLTEVEATGAIDPDSAAGLLPVLVRCFARQHELPTVADYEALKAESAEMAWISTEGNAFNHATDRVADVEALTVEQKALGRPMKEVVETSRSGRVRQTAFLAAKVMRELRTGNGSVAEREVPGSFIEFITRLSLPDTAALDLSFDSSNAQAIFKMTAAGT